MLHHTTQFIKKRRPSTVFSHFFHGYLLIKSDPQFGKNLDPTVYSSHVVQYIVKFLKFNI